MANKGEEGTNHWLDFAEKIADEKRNKELEKLEESAKFDELWQGFITFYKDEMPSYSTSLINSELSKREKIGYSPND